MAKLLCKRGKYQQFSIDPLTQARLSYSIECTQHLTGIQPSTSGIVRAAIAGHVQKLEECLQVASDDLKVLSLRQAIKKASQGDSVDMLPIPPAGMNKGGYPALSDLIKRPKEYFKFLKHPMKGGRR